MEYFTSEKMSEHMYRIIECSGVCCYLVIGEKQACLLDTGCGYGDIKAYVETLTNKEIFVILTHAHHDHMGAASLFDRVYMNPDETPVFQVHGDNEFRMKEIEEHPIEGMRITSIVPTRTAPMIPVSDQDCFDLGGVVIQMILVKGHTPGILCPLIVEDRAIIFGDACGVGVLLFDEFSSNVSQYRTSLIQLKSHEDAYDSIYRNHGTFTSSKELLDNVIECCDLILAGKDDHIPSDFHGYSLFAAKQTKAHARVDGKEGNIMYALNKAN